MVGPVDAGRPRVDRILAGGDYPNQIGSLGKMLASIEALDLSDGDRAKIMSGNAARLLGI
jgi:predicted TIM-barrel fold metal-dependent hydrolase